MNKLTNMVIFFFLLLLALKAQGQDKIKVEEIIAKHLKSIGDQKVNNQVATGDVSFRILRSGGAGANGKIVIASEGKKLLLGMSFPVANYPREIIVFDGKDSKVSFAYQNARSPFGNYLYRYTDILERNLLGGVLSTGWALLNESDARISLKGTKKINGREAYVLDYLPKRGSDLEISIYIDKENFQHLRTEYRRIISAGQSTSPDASSNLRERREILMEDFSDYKQVNGLTLPHKYRIYLMLEGQTQGLNEYEWTINFNSFLFNQQLDPNSFNTKDK
jgi:hypothetical protein